MVTDSEKKLFNYFDKNWLKKNTKLYNYYNIINENDYYNNKIINHFNATNNIAESIHAKISTYIPKKKFLIMILFMLFKIY